MKKDILAKIQETSKKYASQMGYAKKEPRKEMTMREMLAKTRKPLTEQRHKYISEEGSLEDDIQVTKLSAQEEQSQEDAMRNFFDDDNVTINFNPIEIYKRPVTNTPTPVTENENGTNTLGIFWAGTIDGQLKFAYTVTADEATSGVKIERAPTFDPNNPDNQDIEKKVIDYYDSFYEYWSKNELEN